MCTRLQQAHHACCSQPRNTHAPHTLHLQAALGDTEDMSVAAALLKCGWKAQDPLSVTEEWEISLADWMLPTACVAFLPHPPPSLSFFSQDYPASCISYILPLPLTLTLTKRQTSLKWALPDSTYMWFGPDDRYVLDQRTRGYAASNPNLNPNPNPNHNPAVPGGM
jgi:hypothetical protein